MRRLPSFLLILSFLLSLAMAQSALAAARVPEIDAGGLLKRINDDLGKVVVVNIFASWCPPCREEIPGLVNVSKSFAASDLTVLGVSVDNEPKALDRYLSELRIPYPVLRAKGDFIERVGVKAVPQLLIYNKKGELVVNHKGLVDEADLRKAITEIMAE